MDFAKRLRLTKPSQVCHLAGVLRSAPDIADLFRKTRPLAPPSLTEIFLRRIAADPHHLQDRLAQEAGESAEQALERVLQQEDGLALLHYHTARLLSPGGQAEERICDGSARRVLLAGELDVALVRNAASSALTDLGRRIRRGRGGDRRGRDTPPRHLMIDYLLETYCDVTGRLPGFTNYPDRQEIGGPAVQFIRAVLPTLGFRVPSKNTLSRQIAEFRRRNNGRFPQP